MSAADACMARSGLENNLGFLEKVFRFCVFYGFYRAMLAQSAVMRQ